MGATCRRPTLSASSTHTGKNADITRNDERAILEERDSQQIASLEALLGRIPDLREDAWRAELGLMKTRYGAKKPRAADLNEAIARVSAWAEGKVEEARSATTVALANANDLAGRLALSEQARKNAETIEAASRLANENRIDKLEKENARQKNVVLQRTAYGIVGVSLLVILLSGVAIYLSPNKLGALADAGPFAIGGVLGLGLAQIITRPWFVPACGIVITFIVLGCVWWAYRKNQQGKLAAALNEKAAQTQAVATKVIPAIDATYDAMRNGLVATAEEAFKDLYGRLSKVMNEPEKARVHELRATIKNTQN